MNTALKSKCRVALGWMAFGLAFGAALLSAPALAAREVAIVLLHTADVHGHVAAVSSEREQKPGGGLLRCATRIAEIRRQDANTVLVDCGDLVRGSPESFLTQGRIVADAVRQMRYDALVPGNHEFDDGTDALRRFYDQAQIPVLAANINAQPDLPGACPFLCKDVDGVRVAIVGLSNPLIPLWSRPRLLANVRVEASLDALRRVMPLVRAQKPDILVLAVHQGWREWGDDRANGIQAIARAFPEFDVILGAHTHQAVEWKTVNGIAYTQAGTYGLWLGVVRLVFDTQARRVKSKRIQLLAVDSTVAPDKILEDKVARPLKETRQYLKQEAGVAAVELKPTSRVGGQSAIQTLIALAVAGRVGADVVIHGTLSDASLRAGRITMRDVWRIVPYDNYIGVARLTLDELRQILEENSGFFKSRDFRGVCGVTYDLNPKAVTGQRVSNIRLTGGVEINGKAEKTRTEGVAPAPSAPGRCGEQAPANGAKPLTERIRVAFNSYDMASAGGRFPRLRAILEQDTSRLEEFPDVDTRAVVIEYLRRHQPLDIQVAPGAHVVREPK